MVSARSLELFFIDGRPDGMLTAEVFNWTGHVLKTPRTQIKQALSRPESGFTGVYILLGEDNGEPRAYIGESEDIGNRLRDHVIKKDWWNEAVLITSAADNLHKAHVKYLESRLVELARIAGVTPLENGNTPPRSSLSEAARANMESFLETLMIVLPAIRVDMFVSKARERSVQKNQPLSDIGIEFRLSVPKYGAVGSCYVESGEIIVQSGSIANAYWVHPQRPNYGKIHKSLVERGILLVDGQNAVFTQDFAFSSLSAAASVLIGRETGGRTAWKLKSDGRTYAQWEKDQLKDPSA
ncbi:GIY-YIG nuclease family protein [Cochlodiniinecator piscidefendens]|uniref:GIY-YIG nuclease family protein n=1 Tax=Cochlodiniinecator piscidefendens TaxID=2715756 RepID=UPI00140B1F64|nr:GIY-YIG nuclease family protein [Cochlodiniinecator piscidefendens]